LDAVIATHVPPEGLGFLLCPDRRAPRSPLAAIAVAPVDVLGALIAAATQDAPLHVDAAAIAPLLGLGPGLTPSGDDFIGGVLIALALIGLSALRDRLWSALAPLAPAATNQISCAHLAAAAQGLGHAALHAALGEILVGGRAGLAGHIRMIGAI